MQLVFFTRNTVRYINAEEFQALSLDKAQCIQMTLVYQLRIQEKYIEEYSSRD